MKLLMSALVLLVSADAFANQDLAGKNLIFQYEDQQHYLVSFSESTVTWKCIQGDELGRQETDTYQSARIADGIYFINWTESDGAFVDIVVNLKDNKVHSSGQVKDFKWFRQGSINPVPGELRKS